MQFKIPKSDKYQWTQHAQYKMQQYGLSPQRVIRVIRNPERTEEGIVEKTIAVMQPTSISTKDGKRVWSSEIWSMYQVLNSAPPHPALRATLSPIGRGKLGSKIKIISAWRYPGVSPKNNPIPEDIIREIEDLA